MKIFAIESSCDESAVAYFDSDIGVVESLVHSQVDMHALYGGVVPDLASQDHLAKLPALIKQLCGKCPDMDEIAVTCGPGLPNCLAVGVAAAEGLAMAMGKPLRGVNHLCGHAFSPFIEVHKSAPAEFWCNYQGLLPHLGLVASGGNSIIFEIGTDRKLRVLAETVDDAAGEALDKGAKLLGMPYPGGALLEKTARGAKIDKNLFPYGQNRNLGQDPRLSFSGLKTSLRYHLEKIGPQAVRENLGTICASYQFAVVEQLRRHARHFLARGEYSSLGLSGGVSNNSALSAAFGELSQKYCRRPLLLAERQYRGDNAAMIAFAAFAAPELCIEPQNLSVKILPNAGIARADA